MVNTLEKIYEHQKEMSALSNALSLLYWDERTYMPHLGIESRSNSNQIISKYIHKKLTSKIFEKLVRFAKTKINKYSKSDQIMVLRLHKDIKKAKKIPTKLVTELSKTTGVAIQKWTVAKNTNDFSLFLPFLEKIVELKRKEAKYLSFKAHSYNSLLDEFEEGMNVEKLDKEFLYLKKHLSSLIKKIHNSQKYKDIERISQSNKIIKSKYFNKKTQEIFLKYFNNNKINNHSKIIEKQNNINQDIISKMGLNINFSRLDLSEHSFTIRIGVDDVRITTNHRENDFLFSFFSTIHEAGHALYELGYPKDFKDTVIYDAASYGLHESQSRFWENMIARNKIFWENYFEIFQQEFDDLKEIDLDSWFFLINMSKKSKVRIEADEISYVLHIIIRYEIEKKLIEGNLKPCDVPKEWNKMYKELLDVDISNDSEGCLQDMHWSDGAIGYFPSYAIGTIYAVQIYNQMMSDDKIFDSFKSGKFDLILKSLRDNVHIHGKKYSAEEIITKFCKSGLNSKEYLKYLEEKYTKLYEI